MIIEFSVENYLSFKEKSTLSMVASSDKKLPTNVFENPKGENVDLLKSSVIYGANASGKSNFIEALTYFVWFMRTSSTGGRKGKLTGLTPFKLEKSCRSKPSNFELIFLLDGVRYIYGFSADNSKIHTENLFFYPKGQKSLLFERVRTSKKSKYKFGTSYWKGSGKSLINQVRENALFLSVAAQFNNPIATKIIDWFDLNLREVNVSSSTSAERMYTSRHSTKNSAFKNEILLFLKQADFGIVDFNISLVPLKDKFSSDEMSETFKGFPEIFRNQIEDAEIDEITTLHKGIEGSVSLDFSEESDGTMKFYALAGPINYSLKNGSILLADELGMRLHPLLSRWIIELFHSTKTNPKGAQLIFTTHDTSLLDQSLFRRDQVWFTEKNEEGSSELYSLWDFKKENSKKPRNEENINKGYLAGRYGGIPIIDGYLD